MAGATLEHLLHYPYGCLEQTTSSVFPLIYFADIAKALEPSLLDPKNGHGDPADMVQVGRRRIATMQLGNGGFSLWQGGREVHPWASVYATHFLVEVKRAGHPVSDSLYRNALAWLASEVKAKNAYGSEELERWSTASTFWRGPAKACWWLPPRPTRERQEAASSAPSAASAGWWCGRFWGARTQ